MILTISNSGNVRSSNAVANASTNSSSSSTLAGSKTPFRDLLWCDHTDPDEMDGECLKSSHEQHALWVTDALLHASPLGKYDSGTYSQHTCYSYRPLHGCFSMTSFHFLFLTPSMPIKSSIDVERITVFFLIFLTTALQCASLVIRKPYGNHCSRVPAVDLGSAFRIYEF